MPLFTVPLFTRVKDLVVESYFLSLLYFDSEISSPLDLMRIDPRVR
jgi:hypothetical protein